jgi:nuclear pore complex protein Nup107
LEKFAFLVEKNTQNLEIILENSLDILRKFTTSENTEIYKVEEKTWKLLFSIFSLEIKEFENSDTDYQKVQNIINSQENLLHFLSVRLWTEEIVVNTKINSKINNYFPETLSYLRSFKENINTENIVTEIDPDASNRQGKNWKLQDQISQQELLKTIFLRLRRGDLVGACKVAADSDEPWRAASLKGGMFYSGSAGNTNRHLWKAVCYQIATRVFF